MTGVKLEVFYHSDGTQSLSEIGVKYDINECETRIVTFYQIVAVSPYFIDGQEFSCIHANNTEFICVDQIKTVERKLLLIQ